jgi:hypothetical protein
VTGDNAGIPTAPLAEDLAVAQVPRVSRSAFRKIPIVESLLHVAGASNAGHEAMMTAGTFMNRIAFDAVPPGSLRFANRADFRPELTVSSRCGGSRILPRGYELRIKRILEHTEASRGDLGLLPLNAAGREVPGLEHAAPLY